MVDRQGRATRDYTADQPVTVFESPQQTLPQSIPRDKALRADLQFADQTALFDFMTANWMLIIYTDYCIGVLDIKAGREQALRAAGGIVPKAHEISKAEQDTMVNNAMVEIQLQNPKYMAGRKVDRVKWSKYEYDMRFMVQLVIRGRAPNRLWQHRRTREYLPDLCFLAFRVLSWLHETHSIFAEQVDLSWSKLLTEARLRSTKQINGYTRLMRPGDQSGAFKPSILSSPGHSTIVSNSPLVMDPQYLPGTKITLSSLQTMSSSNAATNMPIAPIAGQPFSENRPTEQRSAQDPMHALRDRLLPTDHQISLDFDPQLSTNPYVRGDLVHRSSDGLNALFCFRCGKPGHLRTSCTNHPLSYNEQQYLEDNEHVVPPASRIHPLPAYEVKISPRLNQPVALEWCSARAKQDFDMRHSIVLARWGVNSSHSGTCVFLPARWENIEPLDLMTLITPKNCSDEMLRYGPRRLVDISLPYQIE